MKSACLVYYNEKALDSLPEQRQLAAIVAESEACSAWVERLTQGGHYVFSAGLQSPRTAR